MQTSCLRNEVLPRRRLTRPPSAKARALHSRASGTSLQHSDLVHQAVVLFIFQQDLGVQLQRALNYEQFEAAKQIREKRDQIDQTFEKHAASRGPGSGLAGAASSGDHSNSLSRGITLQSKLNDAIKNEDYDLAASLRDDLNAIKEQSEASQLLGSEWDSIEPVFALGQRVKHADQGFHAVVVGWDRTCCEAESWQEANSVSTLRQGLRQAFYHLLVDVRDWQAAGNDARLLPVAYAAEEQLEAPAQRGSTWAQDFKDTEQDEFVHPFEYLLFLGKDNHGDYVPCPDLRTLYNEDRRDVYPPDDA